ncbi:MAG: coenzyme F420 hydrogenase/dehydrogenase beta subunit N-terminal domain-containing protein, partial [Eubacteriales bacterium]
KCMDCHQCEKVCPIGNPKNDNTETKTFIGYNNNQDVRIQSSSGGIFSVVAEWMIQQNGAVFGAAFDETFEVCHTVAETEAALSKLRGSKYVQSRLGDTYPLVKQYLENNRKVLFTGTACQIAGLKNYLKRNYENL